MYGGKHPPMAEECYICGRKFGTKSIKIHEKQCLAKWHRLNNMLPRNLRSPEPCKQQVESSKSNEEKQLERPEKIVIEDSKGNSSKETDPFFSCYLCGNFFSVNTIYKHEVECLKVWQTENEKLPPHKRKMVPQKEDIKFTSSGGVDYMGTFNRIWENHLAELVPCKICGRTFAPDRIEIHERVCKGMGIKTGTNKEATTRK